MAKVPKKTRFMSKSKIVPCPAKSIGKTKARTFMSKVVPTNFKQRGPKRRKPNQKRARNRKVNLRIHSKEKENVGR